VPSTFPLSSQKEKRKKKKKNGNSHMDGTQIVSSVLLRNSDGIWKKEERERAEKTRAKCDG